MAHTDDTGWRVGGEPAHLMAFETDVVTIDQIRPRHRHDEVQEVIPADYPGVMVTDRGRSDDAHAFDNVRQQTCLAHLQRSIRDTLATKTGRARDVGNRLKELLQEAVQLWHASRERAAAAGARGTPTPGGLSWSSGIRGTPLGKHGSLQGTLNIADWDRL